jgi:hypothetical protein
VWENTLFAFLGFTFVAVLAAVARDQLAPRIRSAGELANLLGAPLLLQLPGRRGRARSAVGDPAAGDLLQAAVRMLSPQGGVRSLAVAGVRGDPRVGDVARGLAKALARAGEQTALVQRSSGRPGRSAPPSLSDLVAVEAEDREELLAAARVREHLHCFVDEHETSLGTTSGIEGVMQALGAAGMGFLVVASPALSSEHGLLLPHRLGELLLVCRPQQLSRRDLVRLRELLEATKVDVLGIVAVGGRQLVPYGIAPAEDVRVARKAAGAARREKGDGVASPRRRRRHALR